MARRNNHFDSLSLGELQLLMLGLWIIGEQNRVDFKLMGEYRTLAKRLKHAADSKTEKASVKAKE